MDKSRQEQKEIIINIHSKHPDNRQLKKLINPKTKRNKIISQVKINASKNSCKHE